MLFLFFVNIGKFRKVKLVFNLLPFIDPLNNDTISLLHIEIVNRNLTIYHL